MKRASLFWLSVLTLTLTLNLGCTHRQLRYDHVMQARSLTTIYEQQVLDNLAMFSQDLDSLPFFAVPGVGSSAVNDSGGGNIGVLNGPGRTAVGPFSFGRTNTQSWAVTPITESDRLERMQLLYQTAISSGIAVKSSGRRAPSSECELKGTHCGSSIHICGQNRAAFTRLVLDILDAALNDPPAAPEMEPEATVEVERFVYNDDKTVKEVQRFNQKGSELGINAVMPVTAGSSGGNDSGSSSRNRSAVRENIGEQIREQQKQVLRGVLFPTQ